MLAAPPLIRRKLRVLLGLAKYDDAVLMFTVSSFSISVALTLAVVMSQDISSRHQAIGGFIPSRELDNEVHKAYMRRFTEQRIVHGLNPFCPLKYTTNEGHANLLKRFSTGCSTEYNSVTASYTCKFDYKEANYTVTSAYHEMAICIAFLKSCGHKDLN